MANEHALTDELRGSTAIDVARVHHIASGVIDALGERVHFALEPQHIFLRGQGVELRGFDRARHSCGSPPPEPGLLARRFKRR